MIKATLVFIFYFVLSAVSLYLLITIAVTFAILEWRLSVFNIAMWDKAERLFFFIFVFGGALLGAVNNSINKQLR
jgi:hypothetical protein